MIEQVACCEFEVELQAPYWAFPHSVPIKLQKQYKTHSFYNENMRPIASLHN